VRRPRRRPVRAALAGALAGLFVYVAAHALSGLVAEPPQVWPARLPEALWASLQAVTWWTLLFAGGSAAGAAAVSLGAARGAVFARAAGLVLLGAGAALAWGVPGPAREAGLGPADLPLLAAVVAGVAMAAAAALPVPRLLRFSRGEPARPRERLRAVLGGITGGAAGLGTYLVGAVALAMTTPVPRAIEELPTELSRALVTFTYWEMALVAAGAALGATVARYRWRAAGLLGYLGLLCVIGGFLLYSLTVAIPQVPPGQRWLSYVLLTAEVGGLSLVAVFAFYSVDVAARRRWNRRPEGLPWSADHKPKIAVQIPVFNEPFELVTHTIACLVEQDYPRDRFVVQVLDDSTDPAARERLANFCRQVGAWHITRPDRRGFKAGALNHATALLPEDFELCAVVDADYWVQPDYLSSIAGYFVDPTVGFVQTPQDYRNVDESFLTRQYKRAEAYFYHAIMPSRNEENAIIFCGTMGILRRSALLDAGGWAEDQICEDAEVSVRLVARGWNSIYVPRSFGRGLMPAVFEAYKKQFHRWAFGNVRILFTHLGRILRSDMTWRQKFDYVGSSLHWFDGVFVLTIALALLYVGLGNVLGFNAVTHHQRELALLALIPVFLLVDGATRLHLALASAGRVRIRDTLAVQGMWFAIKFTNMTAALKCAVGVRAPFVRTPKEPGGKLSRLRAAGRSLRLCKGEAAMAAVLFAVAAANVRIAILAPGTAPQGTLLLSGWLCLYGLFFACAPLYAYLSYRTLRPMPAVAPARVRAPAVALARPG